MEKKFTDFYNAYWWLYEHPLFQYELPKNEFMPDDEVFTDSFFDHSLYMMVVKVNPENNTIEEDETLNTKTQVWFETHINFDYERQCTQTHLLWLDIGGDTYDEAMINLANLVYEYYGEGKELLIDPWEEDDEETEIQS